MKTLSRISLALLAIMTLAVPAARVDGYDWKQKVTYTNDPTKGSPSTARTYPTWVAEPQIESRRAYSYEPAAAPSFKAGETVVVTAANANLKLGDRVVASVPRGQRIAVASVEGPWVGTNIEQNGQNVGGWILASDFATGNGSPGMCR